MSSSTEKQPNITETNNKISKRSGMRHNTKLTLAILSLLAVACEKPDEIKPNINIPRKEIPIEKPERIRVNGNQVCLGEATNPVATCTDNIAIDRVLLTIDDKTTTSATINKSGRTDVKITTYDTSQNSKDDLLTIIYNDKEPAFSFVTKETEITVSQGDKITKNNNKEAFIGSEKICAWNNDDFDISVIFKGNTIQLPFPVENGEFEFVLTNTQNGKHISKNITIKVEEVDNNQPPTIERKYSSNVTPNICGGVVVTTENNQLKFGNENINKVIYQGEDDNTPICTPSFEINGNIIQSGETINLPDGDYTGKFSLVDKEGKPNSVEFPIKSESIDLSYLDNNMRVDQEIDLIKNIPSGINVTKVEIEIGGQKQEIAKSNWHNYKPTLSGQCNIYVTWNGDFGNSGIKETSLTIKGPEFEAPQLDKINIFETTFPRYKNLNQAAKNYVKPLLEVAYYASSRCRDPNTTSIILAETDSETNNIGSVIGSSPDEHVAQLKFHTNLWCPDIEIKSCTEKASNGGSIKCLENYINQHPDLSFIISCASDPTVCSNREEWHKLEDIESIERILNNPRVIMITADENKLVGLDKRISYNENVKTGNHYGLFSVNGNQNNHFISMGELPGSDKNYFSPQHGEGLKCFKPEGFEEEGCTTPLFMYGVVNRDYTQYTQTDGSMSAASAAGMLRAASETIRSNRRNKNDNSTITQAEAARIIKKNYLKTEKSKYKDPNTNQLVEGPSCSRIDGQKIKDNEIIGLDQLEKIQLKASTDDTPLPNRKGIYYEGKGIYFKVGGQKYSNVKAYQSILEQAIKSGNIEEWGWSWTLFKDQGGEDDYVDIKTGSTDNNAKIFIECDSLIRKTIDLSEANYNTSSINYTKDIRLSQVAPIQRNMIADIPHKITSKENIILGNHIKIDGPLKSYTEVYEKGKGRIAYKDAEKSPNILDLQVRFNPSLAENNSDIEGEISLCNIKGETIQTQKVYSHVTDSDTKFAQTSPQKINTSPNIHNLKTTSPTKGLYKSSIYNTLSQGGKSYKFAQQINPHRKNNYHSPRSQLSA